MANNPIDLDGIFHALADPTRRTVVTRLCQGPASVSELAQDFEMALPSFLKHIQALEESGWISTWKQGRVRSCSLNREALLASQSWLRTQQQLWEARTNRLEQFLYAQSDLSSCTSDSGEQT